MKDVLERTPHFDPCRDRSYRDCSYRDRPTAAAGLIGRVDVTA